MRRSGVVGRKGVCCRAWRMHSANNKEMYNILSETRSQQLHALWWTETYNVITHYIYSLGPSSIAYVPTTKHPDSSNNIILFLTILWKRHWSRDKAMVRIKDNELRYIYVRWKKTLEWRQWYKVQRTVDRLERNVPQDTGAV